MAETVKKTSKPRKTASKKSTNSDPVMMNHHSVEKEQAVSHEEVAQLAHLYWQQRGHKHGHHKEDWFRAEQELRRKAS